MMIKIFGNMYGSINIEFDETGNCDILKMLVLVKKWVGKYSIIYTASKLCVAMSFTV